MGNVYDYQWVKSLQYKYCRTPHYLLGSVLSDDLFTKETMSWGQKVQLDGCGYDRDGWRMADLFFVGVYFDPETFEIKSFDCMCAWDENTGHYRPSNQARPVRSVDKQHFYRHFDAHVTKDPEQAKASW